MRAGVRLLRYGERLIDALTAMTELDDRGRAFAMWRFVPGYQAGDTADVFFRFDFVVEANVAAAAAAYAKTFAVSRQAADLAFRRRADMVFTPVFQRVWLDASLQPVADAKKMSLLEAPYRRRSSDGPFDANLNPHRWQQVRELRIPVVEQWAEIVRRARAEAEVELGRSADLAARSAGAISRARAIDATRFAQLRARARSAGEAEAAAETRLLEVEQTAAEAFYAGIEAPRVALDTIGAAFVAGKPLPRGADYD
jgi:ATP-dependent helicase HepA